MYVLIECSECNIESEIVKNEDHEFLHCPVCGSEDIEIGELEE